MGTTKDSKSYAGTHSLVSGNGRSQRSYYEYFPQGGSQKALDIVSIEQDNF